MDTNPSILRTHVASQERKCDSEEKLSIIFVVISLMLLVCHLPRFISDFWEALFYIESTACWEAGYSMCPLWEYNLRQINGIL